MRRNKEKSERLKTIAVKAESLTKVFTVVITLISIVTTLLWVRVDSENKLLDLKNKNLELKIKDLSLVEAGLKNAQLKPGFSVQYMIFGGAVYDAIKSGDPGEGEVTFGRIRKNRDAKAAYESLYEYPLIETNLLDRTKTDKLDAFLYKYSPVPLKKRSPDALDATRYTVLSISCFGGTVAKDVELIYEERMLPNEAFFFPPEGIRYMDRSIEHAEGAPVQSDLLPYIKTMKVLRLGDIQPGHGRIVPIQIGFYPEDVFDKDGNPWYVEVIGSFHLKPVKIRFTTLSGDVIEQPIREQLQIPMPMSDFIDIRG